MASQSPTIYFGDLHDARTAELIGPATQEDLRRSLAAGGAGTFDRDGRYVFVAGSTEEAEAIVFRLGVRK